MSLVTLAALLSTLLLSRGGDGEPGARSDEALVVPGGFADDAGEVLYLTGAKDGVVAVDAASGDLLWECAEASRPLVLLDRRLAVLRFVPGRRNVLHVWFLDLEKKGARAVESEPLVLPEWVDVGSVWGLGYGRRLDPAAASRSRCRTSSRPATARC